MPLPPFGNANPLSSRLSRMRPGYGQGAALGGSGGGGIAGDAGAVPGAAAQPAPAGQPTPDAHAGAVSITQGQKPLSYQGTDVAGQWYDNRVVAPQQAQNPAGGGNGIDLPPPPNPNHPAIEVPPPGGDRVMPPDFHAAPGGASSPNGINLPPPHGGYARPNWMGPFGGSVPPQQQQQQPPPPPNQYANPAYGAQITNPNAPGTTYPATPIPPTPPKNPTDMPAIPGGTPPASGTPPPGSGQTTVNGNTYSPGMPPPAGYQWQTNARGQQVLVRV